MVAWKPTVTGSWSRCASSGSASAAGADRASASWRATLRTSPGHLSSSRRTSPAGHGACLVPSGAGIRTCDARTRRRRRRTSPVRRDPGIPWAYRSAEVVPWTTGSNSDPCDVSGASVSGSPSRTAAATSCSTGDASPACEVSGVP